MAVRVEVQKKKQSSSLAFIFFASPIEQRRREKKALLALLLSSSLFHFFSLRVQSQHARLLATATRNDQSLASLVALVGRLIDDGKRNEGRGAPFVEPRGAKIRAPLLLPPPPTHTRYPLSPSPWAAPPFRASRGRNGSAVSISGHASDQKRRLEADLAD